jgi:hypothetical protein
MSASRYPDFYIIGAAKCGTTALYEYLSAHPSVFMPQLKEPHFFAEDFPSLRRVQTADEYLALFSAAAPGAMTGEASVWYLYSEVAVREIVRVRPEAKFVVMLRNPVDVVQSLHAQQLVVFVEDIADFEAAWRAQDRRARGEHIPLHCTEPTHLEYGRVCRFADQLERLFRIAPKSQVLVLIYESFFSDPASHYRQVLQFLGLPFDGRASFERINANQLPGNLAIHRLISRPPAFVQPAFILLRGLSRRFGLRLGVFSRVLANVRPTQRPAITDALEGELRDCFAPDIARVEKLIGQSLDIWRSPVRPQPQAAFAGSVGERGGLDS